MHDCRKFEDGLVDLVFDALDTEENRRRLTELESCNGCLNEYRSIKESLLVFDQAIQSSLPDENYWPRQHEALRQSLARHAQAAKEARVPFWKRGLSEKISLPVPAAAVIAIALLVLSALAVRHSTVNITAAVPQTPVVSDSPARVIEVPVIQEKVIVRTVYVARKAREYESARRSAPILPQSEATLATQTMEKESGQGGLFTRANLTDFQPSDEMRIRIVKRSNSDEN